jgi:hypothetical protein
VLAITLISVCCLGFEGTDMPELYRNTQEARISFWEKDQGSRYNYLLNLLVMAACKKEFKAKARKSVFVVPTDLGCSLCFSCLACYLGCSSRLLYKVANAVKEGMREYVNSNKKEMRDETATTVARADCKVWLDVYFQELGDAMPHCEKIHLPPGEYSDIYSAYAHDMDLQGRPVYSKCQWRRVWRDEFPNVVLGEHSPFATCDVCGEYKRKKMQSMSKASREALKTAHLKHKESVQQERKVYHWIRNIDPRTALSMIIDGMDQQKTFVPWIWPFDKAISSLMQSASSINPQKFELSRRSPMSENGCCLSNRHWTKSPSSAHSGSSVDQVVTLSTSRPNKPWPEMKARFPHPKAICCWSVFPTGIRAEFLFGQRKRRGSGKQ